jgi:hypothetical protein
MAIQDDAVLWGKLENLNVEPGFGTNFTGFGVQTWSPAKFNNGSYSNNIANYLSTPIPDDTEDVGVLEFWVKTDFNVVNGVPSDAARHDFGVLWNGNWNKHQFMVTTNGVGFHTYRVSPNAYYLNVAAGVNWSAGVPVHLMYAWDINGIGGGPDIRRIYVNAVKVGFDSPAIATDAATGWKLVLHRINDVPFGAFATDAVIDNVKMYKTLAVTEQMLTDILANRDNEGWPAVTGKRLLDGFGSPLLDGVMM